MRSLCSGLVLQLSLHLILPQRKSKWAILEEQEISRIQQNTGNEEEKKGENFGVRQEVGRIWAERRGNGLTFKNRVLIILFS